MLRRCCNKQAVLGNDRSGVEVATIIRSTLSARNTGILQSHTGSLMRHG